MSITTHWIIRGWYIIAVIVFAGCKGGNENTELPTGLVFDDYRSQSADSALYPLWVYGSASRLLPDEPGGLAGALDNDSSTAWLTEPGCGQDALFVLQFDSLPASVVRVEIGRHLWLAVPDSFFVRWNDGSWQAFQRDARIRGTPPLRQLTIRLGRIPHTNYYRLPMLQDSSKTVAITEKKIGFLYNSRPSGISRIQFWDAEGRMLPVSWPKAAGFQVRLPDGKRLPSLTDAWGDAFPDTPLPPGSDSVGTTFVLSFEQTITISAIRVIALESGNQSAGEIHFGLAGSTAQKIRPFPRIQGFLEYILPRPIRGRQFLLSLSKQGFIPSHFTFITDHGPLWPKPGNIAPYAEVGEKSESKKKWPSLLGTFLNLPVFFNESHSYYLHSLRYAFRKDAAAHDTLPIRRRHLRHSLLVLGDGRLYLTIRESESEVVEGSVKAIQDKAYYGRWQIASWSDQKVVLDVVWLDLPDTGTIFSGMSRALIQASSVTISAGEIRIEVPLVIFPLPIHFHAGS